MNSLSSADFQRIATAIRYLRDHYREQPSLEELAEQVQLSPFHFQRLFSGWAGVSPKKFLQYVTIEAAKSRLRVPETSLFDAAFDTGLSGTGRLHDLFVSIEAMTPGEYKNGGEKLSISYSIGPSPFGELLVASTPRGICYMAFDEMLTGLLKRYPSASIKEKEEGVHEQARLVLFHNTPGNSRLRLHLNATPFQLRVWEALLKIPEGRLSSYGAIAKAIEHPAASRAVGTAVGSNPVAYLIPCHRVIQASGVIGEYRWGTERKLAMIGMEGIGAE